MYTLASNSAPSPRPVAPTVLTSFPDAPVSSKFIPCLAAALQRAWCPPPQAQQWALLPHPTTQWCHCPPPCIFTCMYTLASNSALSPRTVAHVVLTTFPHAPVCNNFISCRLVPAPQSQECALLPHHATQCWCHCPPPCVVTSMYTLAALPTQL